MAKKKKKQKQAFGQPSEFTLFEQIFGSEGEKSATEVRKEALKKKRKKKVKTYGSE